MRALLIGWIAVLSAIGSPRLASALTTWAEDAISSPAPGPRQPKQRKQRLRQLLHGGPAPSAPAPGPKSRPSDEQTDGHWIKQSGDDDWTNDIGNNYRKDASVGEGGGTCTCPDGQAYEVGALNNCANLACEDGVAGVCTEQPDGWEGAGMMVTCVKAPVGKGGALPGEVHHSIFHLHLESLDNEDFWTIFIGMILFAVFVDRLQYFIDSWAEGNPTTQTFLARVYAELMLFGVVAISIFIFENIAGAISESTHLIVEFVDILCSVGACTLILFAAVIYQVLQLDEVTWMALEKEQPPYKSEAAADYHKIMKHFKTAMCLKDDFPMYQYLKQVLVTECVRIMAVEWYNWLAFLLFPLGGLLYRKSRSEPLSDETFLWLFTRASWTTFAIHLLILYFTSEACEAVHEATAKRSTPWGPRRMQLLGLSMQLAAVVNSFLCAFYVMCIRYNADVSNKPEFWQLLDGLPLLINIVLLLPLTLTWYSPCKAFFDPNSELIGNCLESQAKVAEDIAYFRNTWKEQGQVVTSHLKGARLISFEKFSWLCADMKLHMSDSRARRLFAEIDADSSGEISKEEFVRFLKGSHVEEDAAAIH